MMSHLGNNMSCEEVLVLMDEVFEELTPGFDLYKLLEESTKRSVFLEIQNELWPLLDDFESIPNHDRGSGTETFYIVALEFIKSERNRLMLTENRHLFYRDRGSIEATHWKCQNSAKEKGLCRARLATIVGKIVNRWKDHNHTGDAAAVEVLKIKEKMRIDAETTRLPPHVIIYFHTPSLSNGEILSQNQLIGSEVNLCSNDALTETELLLQEASNSTDGVCLMDIDSSHAGHESSIIQDMDTSNNDNSANLLSDPSEGPSKVVECLIAQTKRSKKSKQIKKVVKKLEESDDLNIDYAHLHLTNKEVEQFMRNKIQLPLNCPSTKEEKTKWKQNLRKIRNQISAKKSRKKFEEKNKKLEMRSETLLIENNNLSKRKKKLEEKQSTLIIKVGHSLMNVIFAQKSYFNFKNLSREAEIAIKMLKEGQVPDLKVLTGLIDILEVNKDRMESLLEDHNYCQRPASQDLGPPREKEVVIIDLTKTED